MKISRALQNAFTSRRQSREHENQTNRDRAAARAGADRSNLRERIRSRRTKTLSPYFLVKSGGENHSDVHAAQVHRREGNDRRR